MDGNPDAFNYEDNQGSEFVIHYSPDSGAMNGLAKTADGKSYHLECCMSQGHVWKEIDTTNMTEEVDDAGVADNANMALPPLSEGAENMDIVTYSVKIYYTQAFADETPDLQGYFNILLDETNQGYANSKVPMRMKIHCPELSTIQDGQDIQETLKQLENYKPTLAGTRDSADAAVLLVKSFSTTWACGMAILFTVSDGRTVSVANKNCAAGYYTFAHEIGHNIGLYHNVETGHINPRYVYGQGYHIPQERKIHEFQSLSRIVSTSKLAFDWLHKSKQPIRSQVIKLTQLLT